MENQQQLQQQSNNSRDSATHRMDLLNVTNNVDLESGNICNSISNMEEVLPTPNIIEPSIGDSSVHLDNFGNMYNSTTPVSRSSMGGRVTVVANTTPGTTTQSIELRTGQGNGVSDVLSSDGNNNSNIAMITPHLQHQKKKHNGKDV